VRYTSIFSKLAGEFRRIRTSCFAFPTTTLAGRLRGLSSDTDTDLPLLYVPSCERGLACCADAWNKVLVKRQKLALDKALVKRQKPSSVGTHVIVEASFAVAVVATVYAEGVGVDEFRMRSYEYSTGNLPAVSDALN
jgi:hypothetical protein